MYEVESLPKTVLQERAHPDRSERYAHVNSRSVVALLEREGYKVHGIQVTTSRNNKRDPLFAKHQIVLRHPDLRVIEGVTPQIQFVNSHDGSSSAEVRQGMWRQVCSNGLVAWRNTDYMRVRHSGDAANIIIERIKAMSKTTKPLFDQIAKWSETQLTLPQRELFARLAGQLRWGDPHRFEPAEVLKVRRGADDKGDLWSTFNVVQENTVRGGLIGMSASGRAATSRPLSEISANNTYNAQLWQLAQEFSEAV